MIDRLTSLNVLTLNTWGGRVCEPLLAMVRRLAQQGAEVFCFQEVWDIAGPLPVELATRTLQPDLLKLLRDVLPGYECRFTPNCSGFVFDGDVIPHAGARYGNAMFVRADLQIDEYRALPIITRTYATANPSGRVALYSHYLQVVRARLGGRSIQVANYHGVPMPGDKLDTPTRLLQSERILRALPEADVLCGDFNLFPNTTSIAMLESRWHNLIRDFELPTTRSRLNPYRGTPAEQCFADYVFVADRVLVDGFRALDDQVSDHLGLWLESTL